MEDKANTSANVSTESVKSNNSSPAKKSPSKGKAKTQRAKPTHPPVSEMVSVAIKELNDRKGSSLQAIKKYVLATYKVDADKIGAFIKRHIKVAVTSGTIIQTSGKGASGSFKLNVKKPEKPVAVKKPPKETVKVVAKLPKKTVEKKTTTKKAEAKSPKKATSPVKKPAAEKKKASPAAKATAKGGKSTKSKAAEASKSPAAEVKTVSKTKKTAKAPAANTKAPKPKKATVGKSAKTAAKK